MIDVERAAIVGEGALDPQALAKLIAAASPPMPPRSTAIGSAWAPLDPAFLTDAPPARRWLLRHPTRDGQPCAPGAGDGLLPLGKVGLLAADGGVGKTMAGVSLGVSTITGRPWFGHFEIAHEAREGRVLLALAEEDLEEVHRRIFDVARALGLTAAERACVADRMVVLPLAGKPISLLSYGVDGRTLIDSGELVALRERLQNDHGAGWSLIVLDPLARWGADDTEKDNAIATRTLQAVETLVEVPGRPTVLIAHHASQIAVRTGAVSSRGVTGIRNGARWEAMLREDGARVLFRQTKSNYSRPMLDELALVRGTGGLLRVPTEGEEQEHEARAEERASVKDAAKVERTEARIAATMNGIIVALAGAASPITSRAQIVGLVTGDTNVRQAALARLIASGRVVLTEDEDRKARRYVVSEATA